MHAPLNTFTRSLGFAVTVTLFVSTLFISGLRSADEIPGTPEPGVVALVGATVHPVDAPTIDDGCVIFEDGVITAVGRRTDLAIPADARLIELEGKHVYPTLIASSTQLGLIEIGAVRATNDRSEVGEWNPSVRAEVSVNPDSELIPVARLGGVGYAISEPTGGVISGTSALLRLDGWTWESMTFDAPIGLHVRWPRMALPRDGRNDSESNGPPPRDARLAELDRLFRDAAVVDPEARKENLALNALAPFARGEKQVFLHASSPRAIRSAVRWAKSLGLSPVLVGAARAAEVAAFLAAEEVPVIYGPVHRLPSRRDASFDEPFTAPAELVRAGVTVAIGGFATDNARNLAHHAGTASAHGLSDDDALRAITLSPAEILGVADRIGSITEGKAASLIVSDGDILEVVTRVEAMWIEGRPVEMTSKQTRLYEKYQRRLKE